MDDATRLEFRHVDKLFPARNRRITPVVAVRDVSLKVARGEVVSLIGPSGCGKSTLLNLAAGLDRPNAGMVLVDNKPVTGPNFHVAFMLQNDLLLPWRTILENVNFGQEIQHTKRDVRTRRSNELLARYHLAEFAHHYPHQLSGGMRQRAALARTIVMDPDVLLLDEPFSALDAQTKMILQNDLARVLAEERKTALFITHDISEGIALSDRVLVMSRRPGTIIREIIVDMPDRDHPFRRRSNPRMNAYVVEILNLLGLTHGDGKDMPEVPLEEIGGAQ
ncbi:MAG: ABC transporter ATP-binding protein [Xanthobacteraceae bacterium]|nr:MAG: ABC transporter ATP-binding protein [Xanthobacteraceae bacterium]